MIVAVVSLLVSTLIGAGLVVVIIWPNIRRIQRLRREVEELRRAEERLVRENDEQSEEILKGWEPRERCS